MHLAQQRFLKPMNQIASLLKEAQSSDNPIQFIYKNDIRTPFFYLEGLARMYRDINKTAIIYKILEHAKRIEDLIGKHDFYVTLNNEVSPLKNLPQSVKNSILEHIHSTENELNLVLHNKGWWSGKRLEKWEKQLKKVDWLKEKKESKKIAKIYLLEINKCIEFIEQLPQPLNNMEDHIHELRRKLRWLSIYCHALNNYVTLVANKKTTNALKKYQTPAIIASKFNQLEATPENKYPLLLHKNQFLALSWMIDQLGTIKDEGLTQHAVHEICSQLTFNKEDSTLVDKYFKNYDNTIKTLLAKAEAIIATFKEDQILQNLMVPSATDTDA